MDCGEGVGVFDPAGSGWCGTRGARPAVPATSGRTMMDRNIRQGAFGEVFVRALAAASGVTIAKSEPDVTGDDFTFGYPGTLRGVSFPKVDVQVKSWSKPISDDRFWSYPMRVQHFNNLAGNTYLLPRFLVLVVVPEEPGQFATGEHSRLVLRHSAYWVSLRSFSRLDTATKKKVTVKVPKANLLTTSSLLGLLEMVSPCLEGA